MGKLEDLKINEHFFTDSGSEFIYLGFEPYPKHILRVKYNYQNRHKIKRISDGAIFHTNRIFVIKKR